MRERMSIVIIKASKKITSSLHTFLHLKKRTTLEDVRNYIWTPGLEIQPTPIEHTLSSWRYFCLDLGELRKDCLCHLRVATESRTFHEGSKMSLVCSCSNDRLCTQGKLKAKSNLQGTATIRDFLIMRSTGLFSGMFKVSVFSELRKR